MNARIRILQVIPNLGTGGAEWLIFNLATALDRDRYDVQVLSLYSPRGSTVERRLAAAGIKVRYLDKKLGIDVSMFRKIGRVVRECRPDIVHTHLAVLQYALPALVFSRRTHVVHTIHNLAERELPMVGRWAHALSFRIGVAPVAIAEAVAESFTRVYGRSAFALIPNGIPVEAFAAPQVGRAAWRQSEGISSTALVFVCVARLAPQKRIDRLIRAFATLGIGRDESVLLLVGDGPELLEMQQLSRALGVAGRVRFLGNRDDVADVLAASDIFALASDYEGHPLSVMEAMSAGLPVVATEVGGVPELVSDQVSGLLVPADEAALTSALRRVAADPGLRARLSIAAQTIARNRFDVGIMARQYESVYEALLSGARHLEPGAGLPVPAEEELDAQPRGARRARRSAGTG